MNNKFKKVISHFSEKQKTLFLIDGLGAFSTAFVLYIIMPHSNDYFGMPETVLTYLSLIAICFCIYSTVCFLILKSNWTPFIRIIGIANLLYCGLTIGLMIKYFYLLTIFDTIYFLVEIAIICVLSYVEINLATELKKNILIAKS